MRAAAIFCEDSFVGPCSMRLLGVDAPTFRHSSFIARRDEGGVSGGRVRLLSHFESRAGRRRDILRTLASGTSILDLAVTKTQGAGSRQLAGDTASCCTTLWFPIDLTLEMAEEAGSASTG
jgi:alanyl-tRNA synthetase